MLYLDNKVSTHLSRRSASDAKDSAKTHIVSSDLLSASVNLEAEFCLQARWLCILNGLEAA